MERKPRPEHVLMKVLASVPDPSGTVTFQLFNNSTTIDTSIDLRVYAICASAT